MSQTQDRTPDPAGTVSPAEVARVKQKAATLSVIASVLLTLAKFAAALVSGSLALLTDALQGLIDIGSTTFTWFAVRAADKPADEEHHYGHGKFEALAALLETAIMFGLSGAILWEALSRLRSGAEPEVAVTPLVIGVLMFSLMVDATRWRALTTVARETRSEALAAEALHFATDFIGTALVLVGLVLTRMGVPLADSATALALTVFMIVTAYKLGRRTVNTLIDAAPKGVAERLREAARAVPGVVNVEWIRLRPAGGVVQGEIGIQVSRTLPLDRVSAIKEDLARALTAAEPDTTLTVTANPVQVDDETALERVLLIALKMKVPVHHVSVHSIGERLSVSLDMEVDAALRLGEAHDIASRLESAIRAEFGGDTEVETHIEPMETGQPAGHNASWETVEAIGKAIAQEAARAAQGGGPIRDIHSVRVRETENGLVVNYHCRADGRLDVAAVHLAVDKIERKVREARPDVCRLVSHAEPAVAPEKPQ